MLATSLCALPAPAPPPAPRPAARAPQFDLRIGFWVGLHHFLYVLGRAANGEADARREAVAVAPTDTAGLGAASAADRRAWSDAVAFYREGLSRRDALFDDEVIRITHALARAGNAPALAGTSIDAELVRVLESAAAVYRRVWWPRHEAACRPVAANLSREVGQHGDSVGAFLARAWRREWPAAAIPVELAPYANWAGAYSTDRFGTLIVVSCLAEGSTGSLGLESMFHESLHQWDEGMLAAIDSAGHRTGVRAPRNLWHALIFYSAGEAVKHMIPSHVPYAVKNGMWTRGGGISGMRPALDAAWRPWLMGRTTFDEAMTALLTALSR